MYSPRYIAPLLALALLSPRADATILEKMSTEQLTLHSQAIRVGRVVSSRSEWDADHRMIFTFVRIQVSETLKGEPAQEVTLRQPGGEADGIRMVVHGAAVFVPGERTLIFTQVGRDGSPSITGLSQGKYAIVDDHRSGESSAIFDPPSETEFVNSIAGRRLQIEKASARKVPLQDLIHEIRTIVEREKR